MKPLFVCCCVGLTPDHVGPATPRLAELARRGFAKPLAGSFPALTTTGQATMLTGVDPAAHGIVANGWYFRDLDQVWLWRQSERLLDAPPVWEGLRRRTAGLRVLKHFWWYAMNSSADEMVTPRPAYHADGRKSPDFYTRPRALHDLLVSRHGPFPLFHFWGPTAGVRSSRWIAESFTTASRDGACDLGLCYLPHLDYDLQRFGPHGEHLERNLRELDGCAGTVLDHAAERGAEVLVVSEYGLQAVERGVFINRRLREAGLLEVTANATGELLDPGASRAFAVCDHQVAHLYCRDDDAIAATREALAGLSGVERLLEADGKRECAVDHPRSGELVAIADDGAWFCYDYWLDDADRPDFANQVEIHKKPGYDPRELFFDPRGGKYRAMRALLRKKLGLRYVMDPVPLDPSLVRGSHGRPPATSGAGPVAIGSLPEWEERLSHQRDVAAVIEGYFGGRLKKGNFRDCGR